MDATEGMKKAIAERKDAVDKKVKLMRTARIASEPHRQRRMAEQHRTE